MRRFFIIVGVLAVVAGITLFQRAPAQTGQGGVMAPDFPDGLDWINTDAPLSIRDLRGKIIVLDFWTYGCINCIHVIPDLHALEQKYPDTLVVIGVHSAKFANESETQNIRLVAERYGRTEPIVNDRDFSIWRSYGVEAWPTLVLIDPEGQIVSRHAGEGVYQPFDAAIGRLIETFTYRGTLDRTPLNLNPNGVVMPRTALRFPGRVLADEAGKRLFIADSSHNRIVITDMSGVVLDVIGSGTAELRDGTFAEAAFKQPQGMALADASHLYVADTANHSIRLVDLEQRTVSTVAGNGRQQHLFGRRQVEAGGGLNSPWDVLWLNGQLFIAMAGQHQLWRYDPEDGTVRLQAGSGREELRDGPALQAGLNQPSGLATDGSVLYVADSEASAVRKVTLGDAGQVSTIVGTGLFDFGDVDGKADKVRLQHPLSVAYAAGAVFVADTYNNKIKRLDPVTRESRTLFGNGAAGLRDGADAEFHEPGGLSVAGKKLYVADTNNHLIRVADLDTQDVSTLELSDPGGLLTRPASSAAHVDEVVALPGATVPPGPGTIQIELTLPEGYIANTLAPLQVTWSSSSSAVQVSEPASTSVNEPTYPVLLEFPVVFSQGRALLTGDVALYYCRTVATELCLIRQAQIRVPVEVKEGDAGSEVQDGDGGNAVLKASWQPPALPEGY